jgi:hypothetical protein
VDKSDSGITWSPRGLAPAPDAENFSPSRKSVSFASNTNGDTMENEVNQKANRASVASSNMDALAKLNQAQVRELREAFQVLDRNSDGVIGRDDVVDMLNQLGMYLMLLVSSKCLLSGPFFFFFFLKKKA